MASELKYQSTAAQLYAQWMNANNQLWNGTITEPVNVTNWLTYSFSWVKQSTSPIHFGSVPAGLPAGRYTVDLYQQLGGAPASTDTPLSSDNFDWNGTTLVNVSAADSANAVWNALTAGYNVVGSWGKFFKDMLDAAISTLRHTVSIQGVSVENSTFEIYQGYDYLAADGRAIIFDVTGLPLMNTGVAPSIYDINEVKIVDGTLALVSPGRYTFTFSFTKAQTTPLVVNPLGQTVRVAGTTTAGAGLIAVVDALMVVR